MLKNLEYIILINNKNIEVYNISLNKTSHYFLKSLLEGRIEEIDNFLENYIENKKIILLGEPLLFFKEINKTNEKHIKKIYKKDYFYLKQKSLQEGKMSLKFINKAILKKYRRHTLFIDFYNFLAQDLLKNRYILKKNEREFKIFNNETYSKISLKDLAEYINYLELWTYENIHIDKVKHFDYITDEWLKNIIGSNYDSFIKKVKRVSSKENIKKLIIRRKVNFASKILILTTILILSFYGIQKMEFYKNTINLVQNKKNYNYKKIEYKKMNKVMVENMNEIKVIKDIYDIKKYDDIMKLGYIPNWDTLQDIEIAIQEVYLASKTNLEGLDFSIQYKEGAMPEEELDYSGIEKIIIIYKNKNDINIKLEIKEVIQSLE